MTGRYLLSAVLSFSLLAGLGPPSVGRARSVCWVSANAGKLIGKRVRVSGYVVDLSSHGFVLTGKRGCDGSLASSWSGFPGRLLGGGLLGE
jgi:hypothetical protein